MIDAEGKESDQVINQKDADLNFLRQENERLKKEAEVYQRLAVSYQNWLMEDERAVAQWIEGEAEKVARADHQKERNAGSCDHEDDTGGNNVLFEDLLWQWIADSYGDELADRCCNPFANLTDSEREARDHAVLNLWATYIEDPLIKLLEEGYDYQHSPQAAVDRFPGSG